MPSPSTHPGSPRDTLGYVLKHAHLRLTELVDAALQPCGIDRKEFAVLRALAVAEPLSQQGLAGILGIDPTTMVAVIDALEAQGIVSRTPDPRDRRRNAIGLTPSGRATYRTAETAYAGAETEFLAPLADDATDRFRDALRALAAPPGTPPA
jgi:DNA-binding MarR family transcriptional regulator